MALARRRAVFCDPDAGPPINLFAPTQKSCRDRSTPVGFAVFIVVGSAAIAAMLIYIIGGFEYQAAAYITALTTNFFTTAFGFVTALDVIMQQPVGASAPEQHQ